MHYNIALLDKKLLIVLHCYLLWKVMHYDIALLDKKLLIVLHCYFL